MSQQESQALVVIILVVLGIILTVVIVMAVRRAKYIKSLEDKGWEFRDYCDISITYGLNGPPFGLGFDRKVDDQILGKTSQGLAFNVFEYGYDGSYMERVAVFDLPHSLPWWSEKYQIEPSYDAAVRAALASANYTGSYRCSIDGRYFVATGVPEKADEMQAFLEGVGPLAHAVATADLTAWTVPDRPLELGIFGRDWKFELTNDAWLQHPKVSTGGQNHRTENVITGVNDTMPFVAFVHRWETTRTVTESDGNGGTRTRTVTDAHSESIFDLTLPFNFVDLSINDSSFFADGEVLKFESEEFNDSYKIRTNQPRIVHAIINPRQMEFIQAMGAPSCRIFGHDIDFTVMHHPDAIGNALDFLSGFFGRVPSFVWKDLGVTPPPFREVLTTKEVAERNISMGYGDLAADPTLPQDEQSPQQTPEQA